jgi:hypothetical protein
MNARVLDANVAVRSAPNAASDIVRELHLGEDIFLGDAVKREGRLWVAVTLPSNEGGYVPGNVKVGRFRSTRLAQESVNVLESPAIGSTVKATIKRGDRLTLRGRPAGPGSDKWTEVEVGSGRGYIPVSTQVKKAVDYSVRCALLGFLASVLIMSSLPSFGSSGNLVAGALCAICGVGLGSLIGSLLNKRAQRS